jgi:hypothetical protein
VRASSSTPASTSSSSSSSPRPERGESERKMWICSVRGPCAGGREARAAAAGGVVARTGAHSC